VEINVKIGDRIRKYRKIRKATQLDLGYHVKLSDLRIGQYETGKRNPKETVINNIAQALDIEPTAIKNNDIDSIDGLLHILFELEDVYGLTIKKNNLSSDCSASNFVFQFNPNDSKKSCELAKALDSWLIAYEKYHPKSDYDTLEEKEIAQNKYALWKAQFPNNIVSDSNASGKLICREDREWVL